MDFKQVMQAAAGAPGQGAGNSKAMDMGGAAIPPADPMTQVMDKVDELSSKIDAIMQKLGIQDPNAETPSENASEPGAGPTGY